MPFFRNRTINLLNLHYVIHAMAVSGGGAFYAVYLLKAGVPVPGVLIALALILLGRLMIRPLIVPYAIRFGLRSTIVAGTMVSALQYPLVAEVHGPGRALALLIAVSAAGETFYWTAYHAYFAALGDDALRGHQIGVREAMATLATIASPLVAAWLLVAFGPRAAFGATGIIRFCAALPLLWAPDVNVSPQALGIYKASALSFLLFVADGWMAACCVTVWQIALFLSLRESVVGYGGAMAFAGLASAVAALTLGRHIDTGHGRRAIWYATGTVAVIIALRAAATGHPPLAVLANALGAFGASLYIPTVMTPVYTMAKGSPCALRFHTATEGGWDIGGAAALSTGALATWFGAPLPAVILLALTGVAATATLLRRYYARRAPRVAAAASA